MKKNIQNASYCRNNIFEVFEAQFPPRDPIQGNMIGSHYTLIVGWAPTDHKGIAISRN